jgi:catechol 2,3-dioxygenase-like lactoylglutathione lyase family enzyme
MISHIDHINLVVTDLDRTIDFYTATLGLTLTKRVTISGGVRKRIVYFHDSEGNLLELCEYR